MFSLKSLKNRKTNFTHYQLTVDFSIFLRFGFGNGDGEGDLGGGDGDLGDRGELGGVGSSSSFFLDRMSASDPECRTARSTSFGRPH